MDVTEMLQRLAAEKITPDDPLCGVDDMSVEIVDTSTDSQVGEIQSLKEQMDLSITKEVVPKESRPRCTDDIAGQVRREISI